MKTVTILSGLSGVGKTWLRTTHPALKALPCLDMADIYREYPEMDYLEAGGVLLKRLGILLEEADDMVVEGYFLPRSYSLDVLLSEVKRLGAQPTIIRLWAPLEVSQARLYADRDKAEMSGDQRAAADVDKRLELLVRLWKPV